MWRNSSRSIDHVSVSFLWTKKFNKDYLPVIDIWIISFLMDKFMYPCVSFVYLSLLSLSVLLFKIFNFRFHVFFDWSFSTCVFVTLAIRHNARARSFDSHVYICRIFLFFSFQVIQQLGYVFPGLLFAEIFSWLKILMVEKLIVKNLSTLDDKTILYWWEPHPIWLYCRGKTHQGGIFGYLVSDKV